MEILHSVGRVGMRVRIPFSECSVTVTFIFGRIGVRWPRTCSGNHMFSCIHRPVDRDYAQHSDTSNGQPVKGPGKSDFCFQLSAFPRKSARGRFTTFPDRLA